MSLAAVGTASFFFMCAVLGADGPPLLPPPPLKSTPEPVATPPRKPRHYVVQVRLIEVDNQGREFILGEPQLQTAGGNAGISIDHPDGRHFEFTVRLTDRAGLEDDLMPAKVSLSNSDDALLKKLDQKIDLNFQQQPRREVLREISRRAGIVFAIDPESAKLIARDMESPVNVTVKDEAVSDVLDRLLQSANLGYLVKHDVVLISAADSLLPAPEDFSIKTYDVADLIKTTDEEGRPSQNFEPLIERIKSTVQPTSWSRKEATATIRSFNSTHSIVVRQTAQAHATIERLLERIRREQPKLIAE